MASVVFHSNIIFSLFFFVVVIILFSISIFDSCTVIELINDCVRDVLRKLSSFFGSLVEKQMPESCQSSSQD